MPVSAQAPAQALFSSDLPAVRAPLRPLGAVSDFVALSMPSLLRGVREGALPRSAFGDALRLAAPAHVAAPDVDAMSMAVACLDLGLLQHACDHIGEAMPAHWVQRLHALCATMGRPPAFVYEDCVLNNPLESDPRLFCAGAAGASERDFLRAHQWVERELALALVCADALTACGDSAPGLRVARLRAALLAYERPLRDALARMEAAFSALRAMPVADFLAFRGYYAPSPRTGTPGPSGRFSARLFLLRFALEGASLLRRQPNIATEIVELNALYPRGDRERLLAWVDAADDASTDRRAPARGGLAALALQPWAQTTSLPALVRCARDTLDRCTAMHLGLARKYAATPMDRVDGRSA